jgi:beta-barrel assembly-enhancing protease
MRWMSFFLIACLALSGCSGGKLNFFSPEQDVELGKQVSQEIESNPKDYPVLSESGNREVYQYVRNIVNRILSTGKVAYRDLFAWQVKIIDDDNTLNAFATPGGYIYVYTGLIKFLDSEDELAGVLGHEMAHSALRHSTQQMTQVYGISVLLSVVTGNANPTVLEQIAVSLLSLRFSRSHESAADEHSVIYLCETSYNSAGAAGFFEKIENQPSPPEFLSTHPNPGNRVNDIKKTATDLSCRGNTTNRSEYNRIKQLLR